MRWAALSGSLAAALHMRSESRQRPFDMLSGWLARATLPGGRPAAFDFGTECPVCRPLRGQ